MPLEKEKSKNKAAEPHTQTASVESLNPNNTSVSNQQTIILNALLDGPKTTIELRHQYGIMQPAPRVLELKKQGYQIISLRVSRYTPDGVKHRAVAKYILKSKGLPNGLKSLT